MFMSMFLYTVVLYPIPLFSIYFSKLITDSLQAQDWQRIAVFRDGRIVEFGTHDDLMADNGLYQEMYIKQASYYQ